MYPAAGYPPRPGYAPGPHYGPPQGYPGRPPYAMPPYGYRPPPPPPPVRFSVGTHRLHWATAPLRAAAIMIVYFVLLGFPLLFTRTEGGASLSFSPAVLLRFLIASLIAGVIAVGAGLWGWLGLRFWVEGDDLVVQNGLLRRAVRRIPLSRIQAIDVVRPLVTRVTSLAEVRVELAGGEQSEIAFRYLGRRAAQDLRAEL
ncbi:PH domain-containing protein, partial [Spirillospora sp. NPDC049652]